MSYSHRLMCLSLGTVLALWASAAQALNSCSQAGAVVGTPVTLSPSKHYLQGFTLPGPTILLGQSYEYLCHVNQRHQNGKYCALVNYPARFSEMQTNWNNVIRIQTIFNHSPGTEVDSDHMPYTDEQPFNRSNGKWSLYTLAPDGKVHFDRNPNYFSNLDDVLCDAYHKGIVVEITLFNVWDGFDKDQQKWPSSPFNPDNTLSATNPVTHTPEAEGFTKPEYFMTVSAPTVQDQHARETQMQIVAAVVNQLKKYPNVIWEVANEPDFIQQTSVTITPDQVFAWEKQVVDAIRANDTAPPHLIEIEGHEATTFAWKDSRAGIETAHYIKRSEVNPFSPGTPDPNSYGAITLLRNKYSDIFTNHVAVGFNENRWLPRTDRTAGDVRTEAWEFALGGGALFDGYSLDYTDPQSKAFSSQLVCLSDFLKPLFTDTGLHSVDIMRPVGANDTGNGFIVTGIPSWGAPDRGTCGVGPQAFWSMLRGEGGGINDYAFYIHHGNIDPASANSHGIFSLATYKESICGDGVNSGYRLPKLQYHVPRKGCYLELMIDPVTCVASGQYRDLMPNISYDATTRSKYFKQDAVFFLTFTKEGSCFVDPPLTASFTNSCDYLWCNFDASASSPSNVISSYVWDWGDGTTQTTGNPTQLHVYANPGSYNVTLTVNDNLGDTGSTTQALTAVSQPPFPIFGAICNQLSCSFDGSNSRGGSGSLVSWNWSFGDGTGGNGFAPTHVYANGGNYAVTLTVTDVYNVSASLTQMLAVTGPPPVASFLFTCSALTCSFDASGSTGGNPLSYSWSFGDNGSGSGAGVNYTYAAKGTFMVTLTVTDNVQRQSTFQKLLTVTNDPVLPGESYFALPRCRVLDTRLAPLAALNSGQAYTFQITGKCGIPSTAKAVSFNVTAVSPTGAGYIDLYPGDQVASFTTLDFDPARSPRANNTIEQLATNGAGTVGVLASAAGSPGTVHLVLDVDGYFSEDTTPAPGAQGPLGYQPIPPCRLVDTRTTNTPLAAGAVRTFSIQGNCGIPAGAVTAALNAAIVAPSNLGYLVLYPSSQSLPVVANLNWVAGTTALANGARPTLSQTSSPDLAAMLSSTGPGNSAHLVLDTMGYFKSGAPYKFHPIAQCRAVWTAASGAGAPSLAAGSTRSFQIQGNCGVPVGAKAAFINTKILAPNTTLGGLLLLFPSGGASNGTAFMNFDAGEPAMAGGAIVELSNNNLDVSVASSSNVDLIIKVFGYFD
ncbi:MAG TPA: PKD domain-containing protein [Thermoanaerobaculia bacterium]|nr:PKD domain-containing protein [Thermoanaerobaculia bacterium]